MEVSVLDIFEKCRTYTAAKEIMAAGFYAYFRILESAQDPEVIVEGKKMIMLGSNNYLGLTNHPKIKESAIEAVKKYGCGCAGSRFLNGTLDIHVRLEEKLASFFRKDTALAFSTGYQTNLGIISSLAGKNDVVFVDKLDHASIIDACRLSFAETKKFRHNDLKSLEKLLIEYADRGKLVVVDGVYSMEGDIAPLPDIVALCKKHGSRIMVDDAHGIGVLGKTGRGTAEHFGLEDEVDIIMGTYSKSLASIGGFAAANEDVIHYMKHNARPLIFSASSPPASVASVIAALDIIDKEPGRRERLWANTNKMINAFREMGYDTGAAETPIVPLVMVDMEHTFMMWKILSEEGVFVNPVVPPAVPQGRSLIRTSYMATHTTGQLDLVLDIFEKAGKKLGII
ncbi:8-amino-7-oxononanoate synthase [bacterium BMS3Abin07]|nr:8-amino-7-oxononanoate synthase [bacterium BMS3Abin07]GBE32987.1 8-amino-7-oxononanoate synthase [bacterium BMS3Bbin05]HDL19660.1 pyridoxal phosphate-dependent aminotransferase family protein [Nitrospirota bacterium]HDO21317.1 pyridoxal phosphate-dependent aminotransferase family protein [Nitrospirota bacterium]